MSITSLPIRLFNEINYFPLTVQSKKEKEMYKYNSRIALMIAQIFSLAVSAQTSDYHSGYKPVNGINMYYEIYGEGKPLVLIHGGGSTIQTSFGNIIPSLSKNIKLLL